MDFPKLESNLAKVRDRIVAAQAAEGLSDPVTIVAVTKGHPASAIRAAKRAGLVHIGESRVQEGTAKRDNLGRLDLDWHLIGHLQTNKAKHVAGNFEMVESVDSVRVVNALSKAIVGRGAPAADVLVQVNAAGEEQKFGCDPDVVEQVMAAVDGAEGLRLKGLMTMAPLSEDESLIRKIFAAVRGMRDELSRRYELPLISMGMSGDFEAAVREGANVVRLGTVLFGERPK